MPGGRTGRAQAEMRRVFWAEAFGQQSAEGSLPAAAGSSDVLPPGTCRVTFAGKDGANTIMTLAVSAPGADIFWAAQELLAWLAMRLSKNPEPDSLGLEHLWLRGAAPRCQQEHSPPPCERAVESHVDRARSTAGPECVRVRR